MNQEFFNKIDYAISFCKYKQTMRLSYTKGNGLSNWKAT